MEVKTFEALNMKDAIKAVKSEFGNDAVILKTQEKRIDDGNKMIEVTAAVPGQNFQQGATAQPMTAGRDDMSRGVRSIDLKLTSLIDQQPRRSQIEHLESGLEELKLLLLDVIKDKKGSTLEQAPSEFIDIYRQLQVMGVGEQHIISLMQYLKNLPTPDKATRTVPEEEGDYYKSHAIRWMLKRIKVAPNWTTIAGSTNIHAFVGPTGSGKTTLVAKLAAQYHKRKKAKVLVISHEDHSLGSSEELKMYAKIIGVAFESISSFSEIEEKIEAHKDIDIVLLDVGGCSPKSKSQIDALVPMQNLNLPIDCHLVLSVTEKESQLDRSVRAFASVGISSLVFTKLDESWSYGEIFNLGVKWGLPLSHFSTGRKVPEDIEKASRERVIERIFGL